MVAHGIRGGHRVRALHHHSPLDADPASSGAKGRMSRRWQSILLHVALVLGALLALVPVVWMLAASFMPTGEATALPPKFVPSDPTIEHYRAVFTRLDMGRYLLNSILVAFTVTGTSLIINAMAGYAFAKLRFRGRDVTFRVLAAKIGRA